MSKNDLLKEIKVDNNTIKHISTIVTEKDNIPMWDLFKVKLSNGLTCNVVAEHGTIYNGIPNDLIRSFVFNRIPNLMQKENKSDYIFLGKIYQENGKYRITRHYHSFYCKDGKTAQEMFEQAYPNIKESNRKNNSENKEIVDQEYVYFIHATDFDITTDVFNNGLINYRGNHLGSTFTPISDIDIKKHNGVLEDIVRKYGEALNRRYIFILKIPKRYYLYTNRYGEKYEMPIFKQTKNNDGIHGNSSIVINELIYGVLDRNSNTNIILNPNYNEKYNPNGLSYSDEQEIEMEQYGINLSEYRKRTGTNKNYEELKKIDEKTGYWSNICKYYGIPYTSQPNTKKSSIPFFKKIREELSKELNNKKRRKI